MKRTKHIAAGVASLAMIASMTLALPIEASAADYTALNRLTGNGTDDPAFPTVEKYLVIEKDASVPNGTYTLTIAPGTAVAADNTASAEKCRSLQDLQE